MEEIKGLQSIIEWLGLDLDEMQTISRIKQKADTYNFHKQAANSILKEISAEVEQLKRDLQRRYTKDEKVLD